MGLKANQQQAFYSSLSTGLISMGESKDDPANLFTDNLDGTIDVNFAGDYRIVDRINTTNNRFVTSRSRRLSWAAVSDLDYTALPDGNIVVTVNSAGTIEVIQLTSGAAVLPVFSDTEVDLNTHVQIGTFVKSGATIAAGTLDVIQNVNNNSYNRIRNIARTIGTINSEDAKIDVTPIATTIGIATSAGRAFIASDAGFPQTGGLNPNQFTVNASSPTLILKVTRDNIIQSISFVLDVNNFESSPGTITAKGIARATNNFIIAFAPFNAELLGQQEFAGATRVSDASQFDEDPDIPSIAIFGGKIKKIANDVGATDLSLVAQAIFTDMKQFR